MRVIVAIIVLVVGVLLSTSLQRDTSVGSASPTHYSALAPPSLTIALARNELTISGTTASAEHEAALQQIAKLEFGQREIRDEFVPGVLPGRDWESISNRLIVVLTALESGEARLQRGSINIRGVSADAESFGARVEALQVVLPDGFTIESDVFFVRATATLDELCRKAFSQIEFGHISFAQSSTEIRPGSYATLDRITEFAHNCEQATIVIAGHTDDVGDEAWNRQLSLARAQAVADHIAGNGIDPVRLVATGLGSSAPIADNTTVHGRKLNRRIEFELR